MLLRGVACGVGKRYLRDAGLGQSLKLAGIGDAVLPNLHCFIISWHSQVFSEIDRQLEFQIPTVDIALHQSGIRQGDTHHRPLNR